MTSEITVENQNKLLTNDVSTFMKTKKPRVRSDKQKENDLKLAEKLREYHKNKREVINQQIITHIDNEEELTKEIEQIDELIKLNEEIQEIRQEFKQAERMDIFSPKITKVKRGRPKKLFPQAENYIKACNFPSGDVEDRIVYRTSQSI
jgi:hypothetical protein